MKHFITAEPPTKGTQKCGGGGHMFPLFEEHPSRRDGGKGESGGIMESEGWEGDFSHF